MNLPKPACRMGYTAAQIQEILGPRLDAFELWMMGQTMAYCDGREYDHDQERYVPSPCAPERHGSVVYHWDVERFLRGQAALD